MSKRLPSTLKRTISALVLSFLFAFSLFGYAMAYKPSNIQPDTGEWKPMSGSDIILDTKKLNLALAKANGDIKINSTHGLRWWDNNNGAGGRIVTEGSMLGKSGGGSIGYGGAIANGELKSFGNDTIEVSFKDAAVMSDGSRKDVYMKISEIAIASKGDNPNGASVVFSNANGGKIGVEFSGFTYTRQYNDLTGIGDTGTKMKVHIEIRDKNSATKVTGKKVLWGFTDIDIQDVITAANGSGEPYSGSHTWAENILLMSGYYTPIITSTNTELAFDKETNGLRVYHKNSSGKAWNDDTRKTEIMLLVNSGGFDFAWGGSGCGTDLVATNNTIYTGTTTIKYNGDAKSNNTSDIRVHDKTSKNIEFIHHLERDRGGPGSDDEEYYVNSSVSNQNFGSSSNIQHSSFNKGQGKDIHKPKFTIDIPTPGDSVIVWQTMHYQSTNVEVSGTISGLVSGSCTLFNPAVKGRYCIKLTRPYAYFTGSLTARVYNKQNATTADTAKATYTTTQTNRSISNGTVIVDDGNYTVSMFSKVFRKDTNNDSAGGDVTVNWTASSDRNSPSVSDSQTTSGTETLKDGANTNERQIFTYSGRLKYDETVKVCATFKVDKRVKTGGGEWSYTNCVTVKRPVKQCDLNVNNIGPDGKQSTAKYSFGINSGENLGRVGVKNNTVNNSGFIYSFVDSYKQDSTIPIEDNPNTWAKPGDEIVFNHQACAGAFYAIENASLTGGSISGGTHYGTEGNIKKQIGNTVSTISGNYLFGNDATKIIVGKNGTKDVYYRSTAPYGRNPFYGNGAKPDLTQVNTTMANNAKTNPYANWTTGAGGAAGDPLRPGANEFLHDENEAEMSKLSPSSSSYKVRDYISESVVDTDVGGTISQTLSWNHYKIINSTTSATNINTEREKSNYKTYTATASVRVPYNYVLQPYVNTKGGEDGIIYLGGSKKVAIGTGVIARVNEYVNNKEAYATITKKTNIKIKVENITQRKVLKEDIDETGYRFKRDGSSSGYGSYNSTYKSAYTIEALDNNGVNRVGDKICVTMTVSPADSHNDPTRLSVYGGRQSTSTLANVDKRNWALREDGTSERSATSCLTVAKRPTMSVESSNAYSAAGFTTSLYGKKFTKAGSEFLFGSWSEYGVFGKVNTSVDTFTSGAALGHRTNKTSNDGYNATRPNDNADNVATSSNTSGSEPGKNCVFMSQTFANVNCDSSNTAIGGTSVETFKSRIEERYNIGKEYNGDDIASDVNVEPYVKENEPVAFRFGKDIKIKGAPNIPANIVEQKSIGDNETKEIIKRYNHTIVYNAIGKNITITGNITPTIKGADGNAIDSSSLHSLDDIVGVVILANNVNITSSVTRINAVIIAKTVNTCSDYKFGDNLTSKTCDRPLIFDGPVITDKLILNRTAGAENGEKSIQRAEIFNLNMSNYLWSFNQMSRYSQAVTTYSRELPTRY